jgi:hypothetical protein
VPTVYIGGQAFDSEALGPQAREIIAAAAAQESTGARQEREAAQALRTADTADKIRLAELRLETVRERNRTAQERLAAQAEAAERAEAARRETAAQRAAAAAAAQQAQLEARAQEAAAERAAKAAEANARRAAAAQEAEARRAAQASERQAAREFAAAQKLAAERRQAVSKARGTAIAAVPRTAAATSILPYSKETRFGDVGVAALVSMASVLWTATRPTSVSQYGWGLFWLALGAVMAVEGRGNFLINTGYGLVGANAAFLALRTFDPNLAPAASGGFVRVGHALVQVDPAA